MLLTKDMIYARLEKRYPLRMHGTGTCSQLRSCLIYDGKELKPNRVYLTTPEQMNRLDEGSGCLILCSGKYVPVKDTQDVIFVESQPEILELLAAVTEIFDEFHTWEEQAFACGDDMTGMEQFLNLSGDLMEASFFLVDSYYSFASYNHRARRLKSMFDPQDPHRPSQDILQSLVDDPEIYQLIDRRGAFLYSGSTGAGESICLGLNLFLHGVESFSYRLLMICDDVNYSKWKWDMLERIGTIAERSLSRMTSADQQNRFFSDLKIQLRNTLWDPQISVVSLSAMLQGLSWDLEHHCQVYVFYPFQKGISPGSGEYVCSRLERLFQETVTFLMDDTIVMVRNASVSVREKTVFHELLICTPNTGHPVLGVFSCGIVTSLS